MVTPAADIRPLRGASDRDALERLCRDHARYERAGELSGEFADRLLARLTSPHPDVWCWFAEADGAPVGYMTCSLEARWLDGAYLHLDCLYLDPPFRGRGLGSRLIAHAATAARDRGLAAVRWQTPDWNSDAIRLYERVGAHGEPLTQLIYEV
ncbi:GNAT family N-acetyltransferase [Streptomyces sp.]|uniref:GNAT family N-acetyltransferase n=1 Tax=Streptomyces sp. TaxID=1931 RepID=UPI002F41BE16